MKSIFRSPLIFHIFFPDLWRLLSSATHNDSMRILSCAIVIAQVDIRDIKYLIRWFQKVSLEQLFLTAQKMKFSIKDFPEKLQIWSHLLKKSLMENFIFCAFF